MMIKKDQPTIFGSNIIVAVSSIDDGNMKFDSDSSNNVIGNRRTFLKSVGIDVAHTTLVKVTYDTDDFAKYHIVTHRDKNIGMESNDASEFADALVVDRPNHALFLPLADCVGAVLYDPASRVLMVSHLGRHSVEIDGGRQSVEYLAGKFATKPHDLRVWLSPAVGNATYPLTKIDGKSLHGAIVGQLIGAGVIPNNIEVSNVDTALDGNYFSHSQYLKDKSQPSGRFAIVAMMRAQGEPAA
jgi:copper oxidase (laccase) domain-containing protein